MPDFAYGWMANSYSTTGGPGPVSTWRMPPPPPPPSTNIYYVIDGLRTRDVNGGYGYVTDSEMASRAKKKDFGDEVKEILTLTNNPIENPVVYTAPPSPKPETPPPLTNTHPVTRTQIVEAILRFLTRIDVKKNLPEFPGDSGPEIRIDSGDIFEILETQDPLISPHWFNLQWESFLLRCVNDLHPMGFDYYNKILRIEDVKNIKDIIRNINFNLQNKIYEYHDLHDDNLMKALREQRGTPQVDIGKILERMEAHEAFVAQSIGNLSDGLAYLSRLHQENIQAQLAAAIAVEAKEPKRRLTMSEKIVKAATETSTGVLSAIQEGGKISMSQKANKGLVTLFHKHLGKHIPGATSPIGQKIESIAIPGLLHFAAAALSDKVPHTDVVQRACLRAITGESKDGMDDALEVLVPLFNEIISAEGIVGEAVKQMSQAEPPAQLEGHDTRALAESIAAQLKQIPAGEPVTIELRVKREEKALPLPSSEKAFFEK